MGLLASIRKRSKRTAIVTTDLQRTAKNWRSPLKMLHWPRLNLNNQRKQSTLELPNPETEDDHSESCRDLFQTLMNKAVTAPQTSDAPGESELMSSNNRRSMNYWHTDDSNLLPTAYPLTPAYPGSDPEPTWGSLNLTASAALVAGSLKRFDSVWNGNLKFRVGPRQPPCDEEEGERSSVASFATGRSGLALDIEEPTLAYVFQDGKLVERQTNRWPKKKLSTIYLRYKLYEPYASNYGKKAAKRVRESGQKFALPRTRMIYERPIFLLPRGIVNENKRRLMSRHMLKDRYEPSPCVRLPCTISLNERELSMRYRELQTLKYTRVTRARLANEELMKIKSHRKSELLRSSDTAKF